MMVIEFGEDIIIIDCGVQFPTEEMLGIDLVIPNISYLKANSTRIKGILITHGHEDHIAAIPYLIKNLKSSTENFHIYTFGGLKETNKWLEENNYA